MLTAFMTVFSIPPRYTCAPTFQRLLMRFVLSSETLASGPSDLALISVRALDFRVCHWQWTILCSPVRRWEQRYILLNPFWRPHFKFKLEPTGISHCQYGKSWSAASSEKIQRVSKLRMWLGGCWTEIRYYCYPSRASEQVWVDGHSFLANEPTSCRQLEQADARTRKQHL